MRATRPKTVPLALAPVLVGSAAAIGTGAEAGWAWLALSLVVAGALHLATMVVNDIFDARSGADRIAGMDRTGIVTGSGLIDAKVVSEAAMRSLAGALYAVAAAATAVLAIARTTDVIWFALGGALLGIAYVAPPLKYGYRGLGPVGIAVAYGPLLTAAAFAAQTEVVVADAYWLGLVPGLLVASVYVTGDMLHHRADKAVGKMTQAARFGAEGALLVVAVLLIAAAAALLLQAAIGLFSAWAVLGLLPILPSAAAWARAFTDPNPQRILNLLGTGLGAAVLTPAIVAATLAIR